MRKKQNKSRGIDLTFLFIILFVCSIVFGFYLAYITSISSRKLLSYNLMPFFAGLLLQSYWLTKNWKNVGYKFFASYFFSLFIFLPFKREIDYRIENHIELWPFFFIIVYALIAITFFEEKIISKITEGVLLLQTMAFLYWLFEMGVLFNDNWFYQVVTAITILFSLIVIYQSISPKELTKLTRLTLSIWSSIIVLVLGLDNIYRAYQADRYLNSIDFLSQLNLSLQFFFLGISVVYIFQNYFMLTQFIPSKDGNYKKDLKENVKNHVERFQQTQIRQTDALTCFIYSIILYYFNYKLQVFPRNTIIWLTIISFPIFLELIRAKKNYS